MRPANSPKPMSLPMNGHVNLLGIADKVHQAQQRAGKVEANALSVRMELQADCLAGVCKRTDTMKSVLEPGDLKPH